MNPKLRREILQFIAQNEPLEQTLSRFPSLSREQLTTVLLGTKKQAASKKQQSTQQPSIQFPGKHPSTQRSIQQAKSVDPPVQKAAEIHLFTDGASRGNPGLAGAGIHITDENGATLCEQSQFLGETTNNVAEYLALLLGLEQAQQLKPQRLLIFLDSELVVRQLTGQYRVRHPDLVPLHQRAVQMLSQFSEARLQHVPREKNCMADQLANQAIDERPSK